MRAGTEGGPVVVVLTQGPTLTNAYLVADPASGEAVVIDPAWDGQAILDRADERGWRVTHIWLTHAHFDHLGGAATLADGSTTPISVALHSLDHPLWQVDGGAALFGMPDLDPGPEPTIDLQGGMTMQLGPYAFEVLHTPGHTPGHVSFLQREAGLLFCGDLIFEGSIGRTDLPGGNLEALLESVREHVLTLPDETRLLPGHGPETTVGRERAANPFLQDFGSFR